MERSTEPANSHARNDAQQESHVADDIPAAIKARAIKLSKNDTLEDAAATIFSASLEHFLANVPLLETSSAQESVHQMRVALRRLRAAIGLLRPILAGPALETAGDRAKTLASVLGAARDWDVFRATLNAGPREAIGDDPSFHALIDTVESLREKAYRAAHEAVSSDETSQFVDDLCLAIERRDWEVETEMRAPDSAYAFAVGALARLHKRLLKKSKNLATLSAEERHRVRIALKRRAMAPNFSKVFLKMARPRALIHARLANCRINWASSMIWRSQTTCSTASMRKIRRRRAPQVSCAAGSRMRRGKASPTPIRAKSG